MQEKTSLWGIIGTASALASMFKVSEIGVSATIALTGQETFNFGALGPLMFIWIGVTWCAARLLEENGTPAPAGNLVGSVCGIAAALGTYFVVRDGPMISFYGDFLLVFTFCGVLLPGFFGIVCREKTGAVSA